jgi:hypothetical protein
MWSLRTNVMLPLNYILDFYFRAPDMLGGAIVVGGQLVVNNYFVTPLCMQ